MINIQDWGRCAYRTAWEMQKILFNDLIADPLRNQEHIVVVEHSPVYTLGFHGTSGNLIVSEQKLTEMGAECVRIERGGDITYHGPGQLVVYPIIYLHKHHLGVKQYIELLEHSVISLLGQWNITATSNNDAIGVWIDWGTPTARKICAIGVKISHGVTMHGLALNVNTDLNAFVMINPCGITDKGVTSMEQELGKKIDFNSVKSKLSQIILRNLD